MVWLLGNELDYATGSKVDLSDRSPFLEYELYLCWCVCQCLCTCMCCQSYRRRSCLYSFHTTIPQLHLIVWYDNQIVNPQIDHFYVRNQRDCIVISMSNSPPTRISVHFPGWQHMYHLITPWRASTECPVRGSSRHTCRPTCCPSNFGPQRQKSYTWLGTPRMLQFQITTITKECTATREPLVIISKASWMVI